MADTPSTPGTEPRVIGVLTPHLIDRIAAKCTPALVDNTTTDIMAGYQLGIQRVLHVLRTGGF